jgi:hypothetical protein
VQATGKYSFDEGICCDDFRSYAENSRDFRHYIPVNFVNTFLRKDQYVHPYLYRRLVLQGRWWRIYAEKEFQDLSKSLGHVIKAKENTFEFTLKLLEDEIESDLKNIDNKILHTFPNKSLEEFLAHILRNITNVIVTSVEVKRGRSDFGADIVFQHKNEIINSVEKVAVQAKAYEGKMGYKRAVEDIKKAFITDENFYSRTDYRHGP